MMADEAESAMASMAYAEATSVCGTSEKKIV